MKASCQPSSTQQRTRTRPLTVSEVRDVLRHAPPDAVIVFRDGGILETYEDEPWREFTVHVPPQTGRVKVKTCWI